MQLVPQDPHRKDRVEYLKSGGKHKQNHRIGKKNGVLMEKIKADDQIRGFVLGTKTVSSFIRL